MSDIADAYEASYTIMLNLNRSWIAGSGISASSYMSRYLCGGCPGDQLHHGAPAPGGSDGVGLL